MRRVLAVRGEGRVKPEQYAAVRDRVVSMTDERREQMIDAKATEALAWAGRDPAKAREAMTEHALLVRGRTAAAVERLERERGLR